MKKSFQILLILFTFFFSHLAEAANYAIELKNGAVFITNHYWEEENRINFFLFGGIAGFDKRYIQSITATILEIEKPYISLELPDSEKDITDKQGHLLNPSLSLSEKNESEKIEAEIKVPGKIDTGRPLAKPEPNKEASYISITEQNHFLDRRDAILGEMRTARHQIESAKKENIKSKQKEFERKFATLTREYSGLYNEVVQANGGTPPDWWHTLWPKDLKL